MKFVSALILLSFCSRGGANNGLQIVKDAIHAIEQQKMNKPCSFILLERYYAINWCVQGSPPCSTKCNIKFDYITGEACCVAGRWNITRNLHGLNRRKRGWGIVEDVVGGVGDALNDVGDALNNVGDVLTDVIIIPPPKPPKFDLNTCPPQEIRNRSEYRAEQNKKELVVTWTLPSAKDEKGTGLSVVSTSLSSGASFPEGYHYISYSATDGNGYTTYCFFNFKVQVTRCGNAIWPQNGYRSCDNSDPIYGTQCSFDCIDGYELNGDPFTECQANGSWSGSNNQRCTKKKCSKPVYPSNGFYVCLDNEYSYNSVCWPECDTGYDLSRRSFSQCSANKTWTTAVDASCIDKEPPVITSCLTYQSFYADTGTTKYNVMWVKPEAVDAIDGTNISVIQNFGPPYGSNLSSGLTLLQYYAVDTKGNRSPKCYIFIEVKTITCTHPSSELLDDNLKFSCKSFNSGDNCSVSCRSNLPLLGDSTITCRAQNGASTGIWTWIQEPECLVVKCHDLNAPLNGALACDSINSRPFCQMFCNANYDLAYASDGRYFCLDSGAWNPSDVVPDCTQRRNPRFMMLGSALLYFSGNCTNETVLNRIRETFLNITAGLQLEYICKGCTIANVKVICGNVTQRKKRSPQRDVFLITPSVYRHRLKIPLDSDRNKRQANTYDTTLDFTIVVPWNQGNMSLNDAYDYHDNITFTFQNILINMVNAGNFTIPGYSGPQYKFEDYGSLQCDDGFLDVDRCRTCSAGMKYNVTTDSCQICPLHTYKDYDGLSACTSCPSGHITLETGRKYVNECIELCPAGTFSAATVVPCTQCPVGSYQSLIGQKTCITCPDGKSTNSSGSTSEAACKYFDIFVNTEISQLVTNVSEDVKNLTVALRFQINGRDSGLPRFSFSASHANDGEYFSISVQDTMSVLVGQTLHNSSMILAQGKWTLLILTLESTRKRLTMMSGSQSLLQEQFSIEVNDTLIKAGSSVWVTVGPNTTLSFTELFMVNRIISADELASLSSSCESQIPDSFLSMSEFAGMHWNGIHEVIPSACYAVDDCSSSPCGNHTCVNSAAGFICRCLRGYSGPTCSVAPDLCKENGCQNGATCINNGLDYTCSCRPGYGGVFCEVEPVNGNWSEWTVWTVCSASCGGGSMSRSRSCDSPSPGPYGLSCTGQAQETEICNNEVCPVCPEFPLGNGTTFDIRIENDTETRTIKCKDGLAFAPGFEPNQEYKCGRSTNYNWTHTSTLNPLGRTPSCAAVIGPTMIATATTITYETLPCSASSLANATIAEKLQSLQCVSNNTCNVSVSTACSNNGTVSATIQLSSSLDGAEHLDLDALYKNNTVSDNLMKLLKTITELELSTQTFVNKTAANLDVYASNNTHRVNSKSIGTKAIVNCPVGLVASSGVCVECPLGTYYDSSSSSCRICDLGTYQDESAQSACKACLAGYTTAGEGSVSIQDCTVSSSTQTTQKTTVSAATNSQPTSASEAANNLGASEPVTKDD
ncbi:hypothetical protein ACJMK2_038934 [Sinanodonta woodiana]|uniref:Sushi, von Willebrand factor type A, EGF and pentraxin domain-containing protein 1 n=1 Tax=Sinanodonta woodiana TaxID=1069815 RepID=A0ABD3WCD3_SINWO